MNEMFYNECKNILMPLEKKGWYFLKLEENEILMRKQFEELEEIKINPFGESIEFILPMQNSSFSFYKRMKNNNESIEFFKNYIASILYV
jgi:hypothetical protein